MIIILNSLLITLGLKIKLKRKVNKVKKENITTSQFKKNWQKGNIFEKILIVIMLILVSGFACGLAFFIYVVIAAPKFDPQSLYTKEASILFVSLCLATCIVRVEPPPASLWPIN